MKSFYRNKTDVQKVFRSTLVNLEVTGSPEYMVAWHLNNLCNYRCEYCFCGEETLSKEHPDCGKYTPEHIVKCFDNTGKIWRVHMSGGETFLYPDFVTLAKELTKKHYISLSTNLSTPNVYEFADIIPPEKVLSINAGLHIIEREKRENGVHRYIEKFLYLQNKGFNIRLEYVTYPPLFHRLVRDIEYFKSKGVKTVNLKIFRGIYKSKLYPESYTDKEKELINNYGIDIREIDILQKKVNFSGRFCSAGQKSFCMDVSGNLTRCVTLSKRYGNFFYGKYRLDEYARPCPVKECKCSYEGMRLTENRRGSTFSILKEMMLEVYSKKRIFISKKILKLYQ